MWLEQSLACKTCYQQPSYQWKVYLMLGTLYTDSRNVPLFLARVLSAVRPKHSSNSASGNLGIPRWSPLLVGSDLAFRVGPSSSTGAIRLCGPADWFKVSPSGSPELVICLCSGKIPRRALSRNLRHAKSAIASGATRPLHKFCGSLVVHLVVY